MSIIRNKNRNHYVVVDQRLADDMTVSLAAKGLQLYLLGRPDNWSANVTHLAKATGHTRKHVYKLVNELIAAGYLARAQGFTPAGKFQAVTYDIIESPSRRKSTDDSPCIQNDTPCIQNDTPCIQTRLASNGEAVLDTLTNTELTNTEYNYKDSLSSTDVDDRVIDQPAKPAKKNPVKYSPEDYSLAEHILQGVQRIDSNAKANLDTWADVVRKMRCLDKRCLIEARAVFDWANQDYFWSTNCLSASKLRKNYTQLLAKSQQESTNGRRKQDTQTRAEFHASTADFIDIYDDNALDRFGG